MEGYTKTFISQYTTITTSLLMAFSFDISDYLSVKIYHTDRLLPCLYSSAATDKAA